ATAGVVAVKRSHLPPPPATVTPIAAPAVHAQEQRPKLNAQARAQMLERLHKSAPPAPRELDKNYVSDSIREILPLFKESFANALERTPACSGRVMLGFDLVADPAVGGLVSDSQVIDDKTTIADPQLRECIQENIYAAQFPPPPAGGQVHVEYPFVLKAPEE